MDPFTRALRWFAADTVRFIAASCVALLIIAQNFTGLTGLLEALFLPEQMRVAPAEFALGAIGFAAPLWLAALSFSVAIQAGFFNLGGDGQLVLGVFAGVYCAQSAGHFGAFVGIIVLVVVSAAWSIMTAMIARTTRMHALVVTMLSVPLASTLAGFLADRTSIMRVSVDKLTGILDGQSTVKVLSNQADKVMRVPSQLHLQRKMGSASDSPYLWPTLICLALAAAGYILLEHSRPGMRLRAVGQSREATLKRFGIQPARYYIVAAGLSGVCVAIAGLGSALSDDFLKRDSLSIPGLAFPGLLVAILGRHSLFGTLLAAIFMSTWASFAINAQVGGTGLLPLSAAQYVLSLAQGIVLFFVLKRRTTAAS